MNGIEVARQTVQNGAHLFRARKDSPGQYDAKLWGTGNKRGWIILDSFSASAIVAVFDKLNPANQEKFLSMPIQRMAAISFKLVSPGGAK